MDTRQMQDAALIGADALGRLMPMYLWITPTGLIRAVGPTLVKLCGSAPLVGDRFLDRFQVDRPRALYSMADVQALAGQRIHLSLRSGPGTSLRGQTQPLGGGQGWLLNLSFGISVAEAVRDHRLTNADFAPTDLTVELLFLTEVKEAVMGELAALNAIMHPAILNLLDERLAQFGAHDIVAVQVPLLHETGLAALFDESWAVITTDALQLKWLMDRDHISEEAARKRIAAQLPQDEKARLCRRIIVNSGTRESTRIQSLKTGDAGDE